MQITLCSCNSIDLLGILDVLIAAVGLFFVWYTLRKDKKIKEAEFLSEYNFHFISSPDLIEVERFLESCYQASKSVDNDNIESSKIIETKSRRINSIHYAINTKKQG